MRKPTICICKTKGADQLRSNCKADQCLCFRYRDSIIPLLSKSNISSLQPSSVTEQPCMCRTCFLMTWLICMNLLKLDCLLVLSIKILMKIFLANRIAPDGTPHTAYCGITSGAMLFAYVPLKGPRLIWIKIV